MMIISSLSTITYIIFVTGILAAMWPCGIIVIVSELFIESKSQVYGILHDFLHRNDQAMSNLGKFYNFQCLHYVDFNASRIYLLQ